MGSANQGNRTWINRRTPNWKIENKNRGGNQWRTVGTQKRGDKQARNLERIVESEMEGKDLEIKHGDKK